MAKKLKKKIEEVCALTGLDWEARLARATAILNSLDWKQELCNSCQGLSFRDLERALKSIVNERQARDPEERNSTSSRSNKGKSTPALPPRTLEQILAQVHAPRVDVETWRTKDNVPGRYSSFSRRSEVLSDSCDDDVEAE